MSTPRLPNVDSSRRATPVSSVFIGGVDKESLLKALSSKGVELNSLAVELFADPRFEVSPSRSQVRVEFISVAELGLIQGATYDRIVVAAMDRSLFQCPLELGPHLRLAFTDQPEGAVGQPVTKNMAPPGSITIASAPLDSEESTPKGFYLRRIEGALWLRGYRSWSGHVWSPDDEFVFQRGA